MAKSKYVAPRTVENNQQVSKALRDIQEALDALSAGTYTLGLKTTDFSPSAPSFTRVSPPTTGLKVVLPRPSNENAGLPITFAIENPQGVLKVFASNGTKVNNATTASFATAGIVTLFSNGVDQWSSTAELPVGGPGSPDFTAQYVVGAADALLPNARLVTASTEITPNVGTPNVITWALNTASVLLAKLQDLTGLSVLGRAASTTGVMAAITASTARHTLTLNQAGTALAWGYPIRGQVNSGAFTDGYSLNIIDGTHTTAAFTPSVGGGFIEQYNVNLTTLVPAIASTSVPASGTTLQRAALTGAIAAAQNSNATVFSGIQAEGAATADRTSLNLIGFTVADDAANDRINITASPLWGATTEPGAGPFNDYAIPDLTKNRFALVVSSATTVVFSGFASSGGNVEGTRFTIQAGNAPSVVSLLHISGLSLAANTVACPQQTTFNLTDRDMIELEYRAGDWRVMAVYPPIKRVLDAGNQTDAGQFIRFGAGTTTAAGDIRKDSAFKLQVGTCTLTVGATGTADITISNTCVYTAASHNFISTNTNFDVNVNGCQISGTSPFLQLAEIATSTLTNAAGIGSFWFQNTAPCRAMMTDDVNADWGVGFSAPQVSVANTSTISALTTQLTLGSFTIPANTVRAGSAYRMTAIVDFVHSAATTPRFRADIFGGGSTRANAGMSPPAIAATYQVVVTGYVTFTTTALAQFAVGIDMAQGVLVAGDNKWAGTATAVAVTTTSSFAIELRAQMVTALAANTITGIQFFTERLN
jgi:hypothetical protein